MSHSGAVISTYYYLRDAQGNEMCRYVKYTNTSSQLMYVAQEHSIYGSSRVGVDNRKDTLYKAGNYSPSWGGISTSRRDLGSKSFELANHLGNVLVTVSDKPIYKVSSATIFFQPEVTSISDYYPFGAPIHGRGYSSEGYRFGYNTQEKTDEIAGPGNHNTATFWEYDGRLGRRWNIDPVTKPWESLYACLSNNPMGFIDPNGDDTSKLTGSNNLLILIQDGKAKIDFDKMAERSGNWDFVVVENMQGAQNLLQAHYGDKTGFIDNLVVKSHGAPYRGPDLDNASGTGVIHDPAGDKSMEYVRSILSNSANLCFTDCSVVQGYNNPNNEGYMLSRETAQNFSEFFLKGTNRNMLMNNTKSTSTSYIDVNKNGSLGPQESYWFNFNFGLHRENWGGFIWWYYGSSGTWLKQKYYYDVIVDSQGKLIMQKIAPINPNDLTPNSEKPKKKDL